MALDLKRFTARFVDEARDHLRQIEEGLAALDANPADRELVNAVFRSAHTVKGSARMLKLMPITETAHRLEDVLGAVRDGSLTWSSDLHRLLHRGVDAIAAQVEQVHDEKTPDPAEPALMDRLGAVLAAGAEPDASVPAVAPSVEPPPPAGGAAPVRGEDIRLKSADTVRVQLNKLDELIRLMGEVVSSHARLRQRLVDVRRLERAIVAGGPPPALADFARDLRDDVFAQELLMEELHDKALVMRMLPLAIVMEPAARLVRDLGRSLGKDVECVVSGAEIELDRQQIDRLGDPIVHLLRNALDHGIESAAERAAAGKPRHGTIRLGARQDSGWVVVEVSDDGGGLPLAAIRDKAVRKGMISVEQATAMADQEVVDLIFTPGFSTSPIITELSGRGVGMDVVKRSIVDEMQGTIAVETIPGKGSTFTLRLPLSLAVMRVLLIGAGEHSFGFAGQHVAQLLEVPADRLITVAERDAVVLDNEFVPVVSLAALLNLPSPPLSGRSRLLLVVVRVRSEKLALVVDELVDERDMVLKPLPAHLRLLPLVSGMVMTGRNELVGVLHAPALLDLARKARVELAPPTAETPEALRVLVVDDSFNAREIVKDVLESRGYQVTLAEDGQDGLQKARQGLFDAVLTDVEMPAMDGFSLTAALRQEEHYRDKPIIIVTSRQKEEDKRRGIQVGADAYIVKSDFDETSLVDTLRSLLG